jgi:hypothetical protein
MDALQDPVVPHLAAHLIHVQEIALHVQEIALHVQEIALHVQEIALHVQEMFAMQVVAVAMIVRVQLAMFLTVVLLAILAVSVQHRWIAIHLAYVHESSSLIFQSMSLVRS